MRSLAASLTTRATSRHSRYAAIDPLNTLGPALDRRAPVDSCCCLCCRCSRERGLYWALGVFITEAVWHIVVSFLRPRWEWTSTNLTIFAFFLQDVCRTVLLALCFVALRALRQGKDGVAELRGFLRGLIVLFFLEVGGCRSNTGPRQKARAPATDGPARGRARASPENPRSRH